MSRRITGWKLDRAQRVELIARFPPEWSSVIADHVTLDAEAQEDTPLPAEVEASIVGSTSDGAGLQAMVVAIDGTTGRPGGGTYHITWSLDPERGRQASESNTVLAKRGWRRFDEPVPIQLIPAEWRSDDG
jgi:hypothetical protein